MAARRGGRKVATATGGVPSPGDLLDLQLRAARLGLAWFELWAGAATVIARRGAMLGAAAGAGQPVRLADPEFALMVTEKLAAIGEAAEDASRRALRRRRAGSPAAELAAAMGAAERTLRPFGRRVRANVKRLGRGG